MSQHVTKLQKEITQLINRARDLNVTKVHGANAAHFRSSMGHLKSLADLAVKEEAVEKLQIMIDELYPYANNGKSFTVVTNMEAAYHSRMYKTAYSRLAVLGSHSDLTAADLKQLYVYRHRLYVFAIFADIPAMEQLMMDIDAFRKQVKETEHVG